MSFLALQLSERLTDLGYEAPTLGEPQGTAFTKLLHAIEDMAKRIAKLETVAEAARSYLDLPPEIPHNHHHIAAKRLGETLAALETKP